MSLSAPSRTGDRDDIYGVVALLVRQRGEMMIM